MRTVVLPGGKRVPALGQGTWGMGESESVRAREVAALRLGIELGMSLIDSAEMYGDDGTEDLPFTTGSDFLPGVYRSFSTCRDAAEQNIRGHSLPIGKRGRIASWEQYRRMDRYPLPVAQGKSFALTPK
jgi:hypothetical protein